MAQSTRDPYRIAIAVGVALATVGVVGYVAPDDPHFTALIPAALGVACVFLGRLGLSTDRNDVATYGLGLLALAGVGGSMRAAGDIVELLTGGDVDSQIATVSQGLTILFSIVLLAAVVLAILDDR
ncbi:hypothetical protein [Halovivax gelatinilyticus]|uniref:hypothetical protein n=1 Tax=Halovivax gelatinilyticus TaxID=2961597 RepID=UPI0020CA48B7|nr:hypothetical protein [Halovivax gelatinilyticus]